MKKSVRNYFIIMFLLVSLVHMQDFIHRLTVPLYFKAAVSLGYDSNFLRFSGEEMDNADFSAWMLGDSPSFDSFVIKPEFRLTYSPVFHSRHDTNLKFRLAYSDYGQSKIKSYASMSVALEQHLGSYQWLTLGYVISPDIFLRYYRDSDSLVRDTQKCRFTSETVYATYSFPVFRKTWIRLKSQLNKQYFVREFTEFDMDILSIESRIYTRMIPDTRLSFWVNIGAGDNISFNNGLSSTTIDRAYSVTSTGFLGTYYPHNTLKAVHILLSAEYREYESLDPDDPLHLGRYHWDYKSSVWADRDITRKLSGQFRINYRLRRTDSQYDWVSSLKTFDKYEVWLKFTYDFTLDLFY